MHSGDSNIPTLPASATWMHNRDYLVERELPTKGELDTLLADYLEQAAHRDCPPAAVCPLESLAETVG